MAGELEELKVTRSTVQSAVVSRSLRSPATIVCAGLGTLALGGGLLTAGGAVVAAIGAAVIPLGFIWSLRFRRAQYSEAYLRDVANALDRRRQRRFGEIRADLYDLASELPAKDEAGDLAALALEQFGHLHERFALFLGVLDRKLYPGELAHARYLGAANDFFMKVIEHLGMTADTLQIASTVVSEDERNAQLTRVKELLDQNAQALRAFDQTSDALAAMPDLDATTTAELEPIQGQLEQLAQQAELLAAATDD